MKFPNIDTYHLVVFYFVASEKSITQAAERMFLTQPTVTNHIKSLEEALSQKLIEVKRKKITLTSAGEGLLQYSKEICRQALAAERFLELIKGSTVNIGLSPVLETVVAPAIREFIETTKLVVLGGNAFSLLQDVIDSKIDLAVVPSADYGRYPVNFIRVADGIELFFYTFPDNPILKLKQVDWQDLCQYPFVFGPEPSPFYQIIIDKLRSEGVNSTPEVCLRTNSIQICKRVIQDGKGIGAAMKPDIKKEVTEGKLEIIPLPNDMRMDVDIITRQSYILPSIVEHFISLVKASFLAVTDH